MAGVSAGSCPGAPRPRRCQRPGTTSWTPRRPWTASSSMVYSWSTMLPLTSRSAPSATLTVHRSRSGVISAFFTVATVSPVPVLDLHRVPHPCHAFLDLQQLAPVAVFEDQCLADPEGLAVNLEDPLALVVFDPVVVTDGHQLLTHAVVRHARATPTLLTPFLPPAPEHISSSHHRLSPKRSRGPGLADLVSCRRKTTSPRDWGGVHGHRSCCPRRASRYYGTGSSKVWHPPPAGQRAAGSDASRASATNPDESRVIPGASGRQPDTGTFRPPNDTLLT